MILNQFNKSIDLVEKSFNSKIIRKWEGLMVIKNIFINTYIAEKYKKKLHFLPYIYIFIETGKNTDPEPVLFNLNIKNTDNKDNKNKNLVSESSMKYKFTDSEKIKSYKLLYKKIYKRFVYYPITLIIEDTNKGHSMFFLYDRIFNEVTFFDNDGYNMDVHKKYFKKFFDDIHGKSVKISYNTDIPCILGKMVRDGCNKGYNYTSYGYCVVWVLWFLEIRLKNSNILLNNNEIMKKIFYKITKNSREKLCKILIGYTQFIDKITDDYELKYINEKQILGIFPNRK